MTQAELVKLAEAYQDPANCTLVNPTDVAALAVAVLEFTILPDSHPAASVIWACPTCGAHDPVVAVNEAVNKEPCWFCNKCGQYANELAFYQRVNGPHPQ